MMSWIFLKTTQLEWYVGEGIDGQDRYESVILKLGSVLGVHWRDWSWSWNSNTLATWWEKLTHLKRPWCWERLRAGGEGDDRGWDSWMASLTRWTCFWVDSGSWWWTGGPGVLRFMGSQRVRHDWATELTDRYMELHILHSCLRMFP